MESEQFGKVYIVATPIGNLKDITLRALEVLKSVDFILCEDTRHSKKLLNHYEIHGFCLSVHEHNEEKQIPKIIKKLSEGQNGALISDAGTPLISDPGYRLVQRIIAEGGRVEALPGPCAAINGLVLSGLPTDRFNFIGFLPPKSAARVRKLNELVDEPATLIFYESPYRIQKLLKEASQVFGPRPAALVREMTKKFEEVLRGPLGELGIKTVPRSWKGEFVLLISGNKKKQKKQLLKKEHPFA